MEVIPAIDLRQGRCVRLYQGDYARETVFSQEPVKMALHWQSLGARRLHVVDLDGAEKGEPGNLEAIRGIATAVNITTLVGGGVRSLDTLARLLEAGAERA
ncbi:MAG: HisA/HisF-related TIM barrel protein, partial [Chloroflexota bacterium]|nr:HisA/HisF-related TIM barrel protein [Chloroflexota bacterium]